MRDELHDALPSRDEDRRAFIEYEVRNRWPMKWNASELATSATKDAEVKRALMEDV